MAKQRRNPKPRAQGPQAPDPTWEVDGEVLHAADGWVEWGGELILAMGETSGGAPYGLTLQDYQATQVREAERERRMEDMRKATWGCGKPGSNTTTPASGPGPPRGSKSISKGRASGTPEDRGSSIRELAGSRAARPWVH